MTRSAPRRTDVLVFAAALALAACSGGSTSSASDAPPASAPSVAPTEAATPSGGSTLPMPAAGDVTLQGAGATFPAPLYDVWIEDYSGQYPNVKIDYQSIGSGGGIKAITQQTVDFGASDAAMKDAEIAALPTGTKILHVPTALGAVVIIFNLAAVGELNLGSQNVADIFLGNVKKWNDPTIAANNPGVTLPDEDILVVHRSDGSGTTNAFTTYLSTVSPVWKEKVGAGKEVNWPTGIGAAGNDGVAGGVKQNQGGIGYVELNYATQAQLPSAKLKNAAGNFVAGSTAGVTAAAEAASADFPADFRQAPIINGAGDQTYPIAAYTYFLVYQAQSNGDKAQSLVSFMAWALTDGQLAEEGLGYAPLPKDVQQNAIAELHTITIGGSPVWP